MNIIPIERKACSTCKHMKKKRARNATCKRIGYFCEKYNKEIMSYCYYADGSITSPSLGINSVMCKEGTYEAKEW